MEFRVSISPTALADIEALLLGKAERSLEFAAIWLLDLEVATKALSELPLRCGLAYEARAFNIQVRQFIYGKGRDTYRVLFTVEGDEVRVHHVRHTRQKPLEKDDFPRK
ncbi:MAG: type II toxin-antitoxin system RelE/ParE family toxin [Candidatus Hydrogenedentes bacterium]|nr:type II toxin-antitoxin system RelE/ParE family toxin [Candidatus Hydrogenedentota bacterium]